MERETPYAHHVIQKDIDLSGRTFAEVAITLEAAAAKAGAGAIIVIKQLKDSMAEPGPAGRIIQAPVAVSTDGDRPSLMLIQIAAMIQTMDDLPDGLFANLRKELLSAGSAIASGLVRQ